MILSIRNVEECIYAVLSHRELKHSFAVNVQAEACIPLVLLCLVIGITLVVVSHAYCKVVNFTFNHCKVNSLVIEVTVRERILSCGVNVGVTVYNIELMLVSVITDTDADRVGAADPEVQYMTVSGSCVGVVAVCVRVIKRASVDDVHVP